jgi:octaprenyl-diphosphate synthase
MREIQPQLKIYSATDFPVYLPKLNLLYDDLFSDGKGFRSKLVQRISKHLGLKQDVVHLLSQTIEFIHNASLLHDDLVDRSHLRRGKPSAWTKYTPEYAVLAGDYLLARVMVNLSSHGNLKLIQLTAKCISDLLEGEWIQDSLIRDFDVTMARLDQVHNLKTGSLFKWCLMSPVVAQNQERSDLLSRLESLGGILGQLFQRSDDLLDYNIRNYEQKALLGDLKSGYLNSFGSFLLAQLPSEKRQQFITSQSLGEVQKLVGEEKFFKVLEEFDQINVGLIDLYKHQLEQTKALLNESEVGLVNELNKLPDLLYWRDPNKAK